MKDVNSDTNNRRSGAERRGSSVTRLVLLVLCLTAALGFSGTGPASGQQACRVDRDSTEQPCRFDEMTHSFVGTPLEQAKCLLRPVLIRAHIGPRPASLPEPLEFIVGTKVMIDREVLRRYLSSRPKPIAETEIGSSLSSPLSPADTQALRGETARYFVIHDTSSPNFVSTFPPDIDGSREINNLQSKDRNITHVYVNRLGDSLTVNDFGSLLPRGNFGTKFVRCHHGERRKGIALHVELIQPRHCDASNGRRCLPERSGSNIATRSSNDNIAPSPGFTKAQLDRLALLYVAASVRKGEWLIPSFHAPMDATLVDGHDDPQNFDLTAWANSLKTLLAELAAH